MKKKLVFIETDAGFIQNFENNLKKERLNVDYKIVQLLPASEAKKNHNAVIDSCVSQVIELVEKKDNIYGIFVDICIIDGESSPLGIIIAKQLRMQLPQIPIFNITNKTQYDSEFDSLSEAGLENIDGVLVKSYLEGDNFSKERFNTIFEKAHNKRAYTVDYSRATEDSQGFDLAIISAMADPEFKSIKKLLNNIKPVNKERLNIKDNTIYFEGEMGGKNSSLKVIAASEDKMGMPALSSLATRMITNFKPKYLVILGIAAGIEGENNIGDILIPEFSWDYGSGKLEINDDIEVFRPYIDQIKLNENLRNIFVNYKSNTALLNKIREEYPQPEESLLRLFIGPFASGSAVIASERFVEDLKIQHKKLIGFDMEVYAVFSSAEAFPDEIKPKVIAIKSVSDFGTSKKNNPLKKHHQAYAAYTSCQFFKEFVEKEL